MKFYSAITEYYESIFPLNQKQIDLVKSECPLGSKVLDVGCATGNLAEALGQIGYIVDAFDLNEKMIAKALTKQAHQNISFSIGNMLDLNQNYPTNNYNSVLCFGNTLVHLSDIFEVEKFFRASHKALTANGKFILQVINYTTILENKLPELPLIENEKIHFVRNYTYLKNGKINFQTQLKLKKEEQVLVNEVELFPITKDQIDKLLQKVGFQTISYYGNFSKDKLTEKSLPLVLIAQK